jgi:hypothetical protein
LLVLLTAQILESNLLGVGKRFSVLRWRAECRGEVEDVFADRTLKLAER